MEVGFEKIKFTGSANVIDWTFFLKSGNYFFKQCEFNSIRNSYLHRVQKSRLIIDECTYTDLHIDVYEIKSWNSEDEGNSIFHQILTSRKCIFCPSLAQKCHFLADFF